MKCVTQLPQHVFADNESLSLRCTGSTCRPADTVREWTSKLVCYEAFLTFMHVDIDIKLTLNADAAAILPNHELSACATCWYLW